MLIDHILPFSSTQSIPSHLANFLLSSGQLCSDWIPLANIKFDQQVGGAFMLTY